MGSFFLGRLAASGAVWIHNIVAAVTMFELTKSAFMVGAVSVAQFTPQLVLSPFMGARADRADRRLQGARGHALAALGSLALAAVLGPGQNMVPSLPWAIIISASLVGTGFAIAAPATQSLLPYLARPSELQSVIVLSTSPMTLARAAGPGLGAVLLVLAGPAVAFTLAGVLQLVFSFILVRLKVAVSETPDSDSSVRAGFRYLREDPVIRLLLVGALGVGFGVDPIVTLGPTIAQSIGAPTEFAAVLASALGIGAASYLAIFPLLRRRLTAGALGAIGLYAMAISMLGFALAPNSPIALISALVGGLGMMAANTSLTTQIQQRVPGSMRGRIMALWLVGFVGSRPLAASWNGIVADTFSVDAALLVMTGLLVVAGIAVRPRNAAQPTPI